MGQLRIVAGRFRGRKIEVPRGGQIRPTADRVREALFSIVADVVGDASVVDAYAGSGALGFEALSRGARDVVFLETNRRAVTTIHATATALGIEARCRVLCGRAEALLERSDVRGPFELMLADPPYAESCPVAFLRAAGRKLSPDGVLVVERARRADPPDPADCGLERYRTAVYGGTCLDFYRAPSTLEPHLDPSDT